MSAEVREGDCVAAMRAMPADSIDAIVTDPPYGLEFMGKAWDAPWKAGAGIGGHDARFGAITMADGATRQPLPNYLGGTNPSCTNCGGTMRGLGTKRKACRCDAPAFPNVRAARGAAFQAWCEGWAVEAYRVMKPGAYLVAFGGPRTSHRLVSAIEDAGFEIHDSLCWLFGSGFPKHKSKLKPAHEPICLARKPAARATMLNIDACRIEGEPRTTHAAGNVRTSDNTGVTMGAGFGLIGQVRPSASGRWPANVVLDEAAAGALDEQTGEMHSTNPGSFQRELTSRGYPGGGVGQRRAEDHPPVDLVKPGYGDAGGASRFFYCAKASRSEREAGLAGFPVQACGTMEDDAYEWKGGDGHAPHNTKRRNAHPTVKPVALMRWLVRLVTPPNGVVLDPFCGSGTTGIACVQEGRAFVGIERESEYVSIARARIAHHTPSQLEIPA